MGLIVEEETGIETVGELIKSLQRFPEDMPLETGLDHYLKVYKVTPQSGECVEDKRGRICIEGS